MFQIDGIVQRLTQDIEYSNRRSRYPASYSVAPRFKSQLETGYPDRDSSYVFSSSQAHTVIVLNCSHDCFLPHSYQIITPKSNHNWFHVGCTMGSIVIWSIDKYFQYGEFIYFLLKRDDNVESGAATDLQSLVYRNLSLVLGERGSYSECLLTF